LTCTSSPSSMPMILTFGLLMELLSSCIFLSQLLSCLTKSSSVFSLMSILSSNSEIYLSPALVCWSGLPLFFFIVLFLTKGTFYFKDYCLILFSEIFYILFQLLCHISFFIVCFVSLWCLLKTSLSSFSCFCVFPSFLFVVSWNFLSASCTFWLTVL
jgi:hypothetical protein